MENINLLSLKTEAKKLALEEIKKELLEKNDIYNLEKIKIMEKNYYESF